MNSYNVPANLGILAPLKEWGGIERNIVILCEEFLKFGVKPQLLLTREGQTPYPDKIPSEVEIIDLHSKRKFDATFKLIRYLKQTKLDALFTYKDHAAKIAVMARSIGKIDIPIFINVTNTLSHTLRRPLKKRFALWIYPRANKITANSQGVKDDMITMGIPEQKIQVIYNPTITQDLAQRSKQKVEHPWINEKELPIVLGVGRLSQSKDFITLLKSFALLQKHKPSRLIIIGEGPERKNIQDKISELNIQNKVHLPGYISDPIPWMANSDVFVLSSRYEGLGNVLIEALAAGTPVVSTNCPSGPAEILQSGKIGPLVPVGDVQSMTEAIAKVLESPPQPELIRQGLERFHSDVVAGQCLDLMGLLGEDQ